MSLPEEVRSEDGSSDHSGDYVNLDSTDELNTSKNDDDVSEIKIIDVDSDNENDNEDVKEPKKAKEEIIKMKSVSPNPKKRSLDDDSSDSSQNSRDKQPLNKSQKVANNDEGELAANEDFISFDFSDAEEEGEEEELENNEEKDDGAIEVEEHNGEKVTVNSAFPWVLNHDHSRQREIADWLTLEIQDFVHYISPSKEEIVVRNGCIDRLKSAIESFWCDSHVYVFGSYATDLYLPHSDIDMVVKTDNSDDVRYLKDNRSSLYKLSNYLKNKGIVTNVEVIAKAKVPIIKLVEAESKIHVDISFERSNGLEAAMVIKGWLDTTPGLRELVLIVKHFLSTRNLNNVHLGGLGGYSTICLVYTFLKLHPRLATDAINPMKNIGVLLIEFFELFGKNFGYDNVAIAPVCHENNGQPGLLNKNAYPDLQNRNPFQLAIQDPSDPSNNISRGSFNVRGLKKAFAGAFDLLVDKCFELEGKTYKQRLNESILGNIIKYKGERRDFLDERHLVKNLAAIENQVLYFGEGRNKRKLASDNKNRLNGVLLSDDDDLGSESSSDEDEEDDDSDSSDLEDEDDEDEDEDEDGQENDEEEENQEGESDDGSSYLKTPQPAGLKPKISAVAPYTEKPQVDKLMGLDDESEDESAKPKGEGEESINVEKKARLAESSRPGFRKVKRDFWQQKGSIDLSY